MQNIHKVVEKLLNRLDDEKVALSTDEQLLFQKYTGLATDRVTHLLSRLNLKQHLLSDLPMVPLGNSLIEVMTFNSFDSLSEAHAVVYSFMPSKLGKIFLAENSYGLVALEFCDVSEQAFLESYIFNNKHQLPLQRRDDIVHKYKKILDGNILSINNLSLKLCLYGTEFQVNVWRALLTLQMGVLTSYSEIAKMIDRPNAIRAVGTAVGKNPISIIIPCHRIVRKDGVVGEYRWGRARKGLLLSWELDTAFI